MKKILFSLTILLSTLLFATNVNASSFNANIVGNDTFESEITLYIQVNNLVDFNGACNGLCGLVGNLNYDTNKIELTSINALESFDLTQGKTLVLYKSTGVASGTKILSMKFKNKSLTKDETTTITLSNVVASDGDKDINTSDASKTIKFVVKENENNNTNNSQTNNNTNTNTNNNTSNNTTNKKPSSNTTNKKEEAKKSDNNYLSSITLSDGNITFDKDVLTYDVIVDYETTTIEIKANVEDDKAIITGDGKHTLNVGSNVIKITIKAEDESERTYTLNINREEKDIVVDTDNEVIEDDATEKENNYVMPIVIISVILVIGLIGFVIWKNKKNK